MILMWNYIFIFQGPHSVSEKLISPKKVSDDSSSNLHEEFNGSNATEFVYK